MIRFSNMARHRQHRARRFAVRGTALLLVALAAALAAPTQVAAGELAADDVLERLQRWLDRTHDLAGRFEQTLESSALGSGLTESGRILLLRPGRMRWDYEDPERKIALVEGTQTRLYLEEDQQLWEGRLDETEAFLPDLLVSERALAELFEPALAATPRDGGDGAYVLTLRPRRETESFAELSVVLRPPKFAVERADVLDHAGNHVSYRFFDLERNRGLTAAAFYFEPPPGTEIVAQP